MQSRGAALAVSLLWLAACGDDGSSGSDLAVRDASVAPDRALAGDLAPTRDLTVPDGAPADLSVTDALVASPDLVVADLAQPDLATVDLAVPDLAMPDLSVPDLATPPDLAVVTDLTRLPDFSVPPDLYGIDFSMPDLAEPVDLAEPDLSMPLGMVTGSLSGAMLGQNCMAPVAADPVTFTAQLKITNVGNVDVGPVTAMSGEISQMLMPVATFTIVPSFTGVIKPGNSATLMVTKLDNSSMPAKMCATLTCNGGYNVAISYMGLGVPPGNRAVTGLTFVSCVF